MIQPSRIKTLKDAPENERGSYVLYWMGLSQRAVFNPALEHAVDEANARGLPVLVCYGIAEGFPEVNARHWTFLLEGMAEIGPALERRGMAFVARRAPPVETALRYAADAALVVCDRNYLKPIKRFYDDFVARAPCHVVQVEGDVVVPVETASSKHEFAARTLRPKIHRVWENYLQPLEARAVAHPAQDLARDSTLDLSDIPRLVSTLKADQSVRAVRRFTGGHAEADRRVKHYLGGPFGHYASVRGRPEAGAASHMSPYLHFGQISPVAIALAVRASPEGDADDKAAYLEELVVRRELAMNHVHYEPRYDDLAAVPDWARKTLDAHRTDAHPPSLRPGAAGTGAHARPLLERRHDGDARDRLHAQPHAHVLGQEDRPVVGLARGRLGPCAAPQQQVFPRRARRELLHQRRLAVRPARSPVGAAAGVRQRTLHERGESQEVRRRRLRA